MMEPEYQYADADPDQVQYDRLGTPKHVSVPDQYITSPSNGKKDTKSGNVQRILLITSVIFNILLVGGIIALVVVFVIREPVTAKPEETSTSNPQDVSQSTQGPLTSTPQPLLPSGCDPECHEAHGCTADNDPTACGSCRNSVIDAGIHHFCVESCESVGSVAKDNDPRQCQDLRFVNVALVSLGTTCTASETFEDWDCSNVMDGTNSQWSPPADGPGAWIQFEFPETFVIAGLEIDSRTSIMSQCTTYEISLDDKPEHRITWECVDKRVVRDFFLQPLRAKKLRIKCKVDCAPGGAQGFRNIQIYTLQ